MLKLKNNMTSTLLATRETMKNYSWSGFIGDYGRGSFSIGSSVPLDHAFANDTTIACAAILLLSLFC